MAPNILNRRFEFMVSKKTWEEFRNCGLLWWINIILHTFGWAIVVETKNDGTILDVYPARTKFRGFDEKSNTEGYQKVTNYLQQNIEELKKETLE